MGMGRRGRESVRAADTLRTLRGHLADTFPAPVGHCLRAQMRLAASSKHELRKRQPPETGNDLRQGHSRSPPLTEASLRDPTDETTRNRSRQGHLDCGQTIANRPTPIDTHPHPTHLIHPAPPELSQQPTPAAPTTTVKGSSGPTPNTRRGCGVGARRPPNSAWQWGAAGANPSDWWMGAFRMGSPALEKRRFCMEAGASLDSLADRRYRESLCVLHVQWRRWPEPRVARDPGSRLNTRPG